MDIRDIRIFDLVSIKTSDYKDIVVVGIDHRGNVQIKASEHECFFLELKASNVEPLRVDGDLLESLGAVYNVGVNEYFLNVGGKIFSIREDSGQGNYVITESKRYKSPYLVFKYAHELQHFLWDRYEIRFSPFDE